MSIMEKKTCFSSSDFHCIDEYIKMMLTWIGVMISALLALTNGWKIGMKWNGGQSEMGHLNYSENIEHIINHFIRRNIFLH
jgi:hypothetical protein